MNYVPDKIKNALGGDTLEEMNAMRPEELKAAIVEANTSMRDAKEELEANPKYIDLKANLKACSEGKREVDKRQKARIQFSLIRLEEMGKLEGMAKIDFFTQLEKDRVTLAKKQSDAKAAAQLEADRKAHEEAVQKEKNRGLRVAAN